MKPDWKDAPEWANWLAMDEDGEWYWYEDDPFVENRTRYEWVTRGRFRRASKPFVSWENSKEKRP